MKKYLVLIILLCLVGAFSSACADVSGAITEVESTLVTLESDDSANDAENTNDASGKDPSETGDGNPEISNVAVDIDFTALGSTMASATLSNIMMNADDYLGKTIKVSGRYLVQFFEETDRYYHFIIITEGDVCCMEYLEFELTDKRYPDDYPPENSAIEVTGVFSSYDELDNIYYFLETAKATVL